MVSGNREGKDNQEDRTPERKGSVSGEYSNRRSASASPTAATNSKDRHVNDGPTPAQTPSPKERSERRSSMTLGDGYFSSPRQFPSLRSSNASNIEHTSLSVLQSPEVRTRLLPPTTPKSRNSEIFLSPSPKLRSPNLKSPNVSKENYNNKPIRELSNALKTRLNYALKKIQNNDLSIDLGGEEYSNVSSLISPTNNAMSSFQKRIEENTPEMRTKLEDAFVTRQFHRRKSSYSNPYAHSIADDDTSQDGRNSTTTNNDNNTNNNNSDSASAHLAFLRAVSSPKSDMKDSQSVSPLKWLQSAKMGRAKSEKHSEVEAIETLMSLSSPKRRLSHNVQSQRSEMFFRNKDIEPQFNSGNISRYPLHTAGSNSCAGVRTASVSTLSPTSSTRPIIPIAQEERTSSDSSVGSLREAANHQLHYEDQTDVETDIEVSDAE